MNEKEARWAAEAAEKRRLFALVRKARYKDALRAAKKRWRAQPGNPYAVYSYAVLLGDCQDGLSLAVVERNRRSAVRLLKPLMRRLSAFAPAHRPSIRNEYYWFSRQRLKQYRIGIEEVRAGRRRGTCSQGVGAAWHALDLARRGRLARARRWARASERAWKRFLADDSYYNAYVHLGLALGVLGRRGEMEKALRTGARLAGKPAIWHEFEEVRALVRSLPGRPD
ncbi:MAG: hypothetical protein KGM24_04130 [Elusimicrobia bacterium]|nr:hypothetical protein [Elusimicrobiota bacterium]